MRIPAILTTVLLAASLLAAQDTPAPPKTAPPGAEATIIPVKTLTGDSFNRLVRLLGVFDVPMRADDQLRTILVYAPSDVVTKIRKVVAELDQPGSQAAIGRNIETTLSFLRCSSSPSPNARKLPAGLEPVVRQLQAATQCQNAELWETLPMRMQEGKNTEQSMRLPGPAVRGAFTTVQVGMRPSAVGTKDQGRYVRFDLVKIGFRVPVPSGPSDSNQFQFIDVGINTAGDFLENQKTVLGKVSGSAEEAIFVVIALNVLD